MIRYVMTVALLVPAVCQAQDYQTSLNEASLNQQRDSVDEMCLGSHKDASPLADSELVLQHRLSISENDRYRANLYLGILWSIVWGGATPHTPSETVGHACEQRSTP
jgi:hypothetical protein